uniref:PIPO n=1 Tax=Onion yellow dwarf virus TaxID=43130 RepID=A0A6M2YZ24_9POTV|nr:PIPO [Onion yellow dwarf virus]
MLRRNLSGTVARIKFVGKMLIRMGKAKVRTTYLKHFKSERYRCAKRQCEEMFEAVFNVHVSGNESASFRFLFNDDEGQR